MLPYLCQVSAIGLLFSSGSKAVGSSSPHLSPQSEEKNCQNQPFWVNFGIFAPSEMHFAPSMPPQKYLVLPLLFRDKKVFLCVFCRFKAISLQWIPSLKGRNNWAIYQLLLQHLGIKWNSNTGSEPRWWDTDSTFKSRHTLVSTDKCFQNILPPVATVWEQVSGNFDLL